MQLLVYALFVVVVVVVVVGRCRVQLGNSSLPSLIGNFNFSSLAGDEERLIAQVIHLRARECSATLTEHFRSIALNIK